MSKAYQENYDIDCFKCNYASFASGKRYIWCNNEKSILPIKWLTQYEVFKKFDFESCTVCKTSVATLKNKSFSISI